ncbi:histidine kinase [Parafilimonas sp.]|uniref:sensor histidine kinase n=1 Tax=Parafilimonas sp. TaxID=1969739 RepID=UPI003F7D0C33
MNKITVLLAFFCLFLFSAKVNGQEYNYYHYDVKDGLSGNSVYAAAQDKDGFMWFGTETGLSRYDGVHFRNYSVDDGLDDNEIIGLFIDSKNRVWIFPFKNSVYYYYEGRIHNQKNDSLLKKFNLKEEIFKAGEDKEGNIIFIERTKLHILSGSNKLTEVNKIDNRNFSIGSGGVSSSGNINLLASFKGGIASVANVYEYKESKFLIKSTFLDSNISRTAVEMNEYYEVIKNGWNLQIYNQKKNEYFELRLPDHFHTISYFNDSCFAVSTLSKTLLYNVNQRKFVDSFLFGKVTNRCFRDSENNVWFATSTQGIFRLSSTAFKTYKIESNFNYAPVYSIRFFNGDLYLGSEENLIGKLSLSNNTLKAFNLNTNFNIKYVTGILVKNNNLFIGTNEGLFELNNDIINNKISVCVPSLSTKSLIIKDNAIIVATDKGVFNISLFDYKRIDTIWNRRATCVYKTHNEYYIGTLNGVYIVRNNNRDSIIDLGSRLPVLKNKINKIIGTANGDLWIGTENDGIICLRQKNVVKHLTIKDGLLSNSCRSIYESGNNIWLGTNNGINKIDILNNSITSYTTADGLDCEIINCIYASGDSVFAGTPYGLTFFNANTASHKSICNLKLLNIQSNEANWYAKQDSIHLSSRDNLLRFEYAGISFVSAGDITYYYQLEGLSDEWQSTRLNVLEFPSLYPGDYALNMYAINKYGVKSKMLTVHFTKAKHYWQLLWVQILLLLILIMLMWLVARARIRSVRRKADDNLLREKRINELEQMALKAQMNPHFIFNSINSIQQYVFSGNVAEANEYITDFSSLVRQTLDMSGKKFITLTEEIMYLRAYLGLEQKKYEHCFNFTIAAEENKDGNLLLPPLLIQPFVENSIRHGVLNLKKGQGKILVHFFKEVNALCCVVEDNGIGRANAIQLKKSVNPMYESKGMVLVKNRIESLNNIYNSDITVAIEDIDEEGNTGTRVIIKFPLDYDEQNN